MSERERKKKRKKKCFVSLKKFTTLKPQLSLRHLQHRDTVTSVMYEVKTAFNEAKEDILSNKQMKMYIIKFYTNTRVALQSAASLTDIQRQ